MPDGVVGIGSTHHFALRVETADEQEAWRDYLRGRGVQCTDVFERGGFRSIYIRDPDGYLIEIGQATGIMQEFAGAADQLRSALRGENPSASRHSDDDDRAHRL